MTEIWLIRHGESESNAGLPTSDTAKIVLTPHGLAQAQCVAEAFMRPPALIVTSPYLRARQSAGPAIERFPQARLEEWPVQEYTYLSLASRHNTTSQSRKPLIEAYWERCDPRYLDGAGAESFAMLMERAQQVLERIKRLEDEFVAIYSHGHFMRILLWVLLARPIDIDARSMRRCRSFTSGLSVPNAAIMKMYVNDAKEVFVSTFSVAHLPEHLK
jgi:2,3-bisphosphoglycerate-dependent phosphoglycerate mutase